jgi:hypothetical protein
MLATSRTLKKIYNGFCTQFQTGSSSTIAIAHAWCALRVTKQLPCFGLFLCHQLDQGILGWLAAPLFLVFEVYSDLVIFFGWGNLASDFFHD